MNNTTQHNKIKLSEKEKKIKKASYDKEYKNKNRDEKLKKRRERANSLEYKEKRRIYIDKNKDKIKQKKAEYDKNYRKNNAEKIKIVKQKNYNLKKNTLKYSEKCKKYRERTKDKINKRLKNRKQTDINFKILTNLRTRISQAVKKLKKANKTKNLIGISLDELRSYLESKFQSGMNWENYGHKGWHIDHIIPCVSFDLSDPEQQKKCFHYTNLQPLWWFDNLKKGYKIYK
jgi:hypothetical protein